MGTIYVPETLLPAYESTWRHNDNIIIIIIIIILRIAVRT
jgi:hypothetical protein